MTAMVIVISSHATHGPRYWYMSEAMSIEERSNPQFGTGVRIRADHHFCNILLKQRLREL
jgi:hypothetical protein